jgi:phosphoserine phosphatase RsbU/P
MVIVTLLAAIDAAASFSMMGALIVGPIVAALVATRRQVALVGLYAVVCAVLLGFDGEHWTIEHLLRLGIVAAGVAGALAAVAVRDRYARALARTANVAEVAQRALLRPLDERYRDTELAVRYLSASDGALIGGDVYDAEATPWGLRVLVADVCGHGLEAVDRAAALTAAFRGAAHLCATLDELAKQLDDVFAAKLGDEVDFATGIVVQIDGDEVQIINCGHPDPALIRADRLSWVSPGQRSRPFGLAPLPNSTRLVFIGGDRLVIYTDGLTEARDPQGEWFDAEHHIVHAFKSGSLDEAVDQLIADLHAHTDGRLRDDIVVLALQRC